jgi:hypothetical protein
MPTLRVAVKICRLLVILFSVLLALKRDRTSNAIALPLPLIECTLAGAKLKRTFL